MNSSPCLRLLVFVSAVSLFIACSTSPISRIDANRTAYESWPFDMQEAVLNGKVKNGMTPEMVQMAVGKPSEVVNRSLNAGEDEVWIYKKGGSALSNTGVSLGGGIGGVNIGTGTSGGGAPAEEHEVVFQNGVVVRSDF